MPYFQIIQREEECRQTPLARADTLDAYIHWLFSGYIGDFMRFAFGFGRDADDELMYDADTSTLTVGTWRDGHTIALERLKEHLIAEVYVSEIDSVADVRTDPSPTLDMTVVGDAYTIDSQFAAGSFYFNCCTYGMPLHALRDYIDGQKYQLLHGRRFGKMREAHLYAVGKRAQKERHNYGIIAEAVIYDRVVTGEERNALLTGPVFLALANKATQFIGGLPELSAIKSP
jgi:hypothetical protein